MKHLFLLLLFPAFSMVFGQERAPEASPLTVHFVGNSYTAQNNLPDMVAKLSAATGQPLKISRTLKGGAWLGLHWNNEDLKKTLRTNKPQWIVLQEQSQMALVKNAKLRDGKVVADGRAFMHDHVRKFAELGKKNEPDSQLLLYQTWAREKIPAQTEGLASAYEDIAKETGARVAPAGRAFAKAKAAGHDLYKPDGSHPSRAGTYLAACCIAATLTGADPNDFPEDAVDKVPRVRELQQIAAEAVGVNKKKAAGNDGGGKKPNILFIYADDQSTRTVGCYPEAFDWVKTPAIDALAERGVRFSHAYIGSWCMPSRATLLTGRHQYGIESMRMEGKYPGSEYDPEQCRFWPAHFRANGYQTAHIGKWHTGTDTGTQGESKRDWDHQIVWNRPRFPKNARNYYHDQLIEFNGLPERMIEGYSTDNYTDWAVDYITRKPTDGDERGRLRDPAKPFYLWLCYGAVHGPFTPAARHKGDYAGSPVPVPEDIFGTREGLPSYTKSGSSWKRGGDDQPVAGGRSLASFVHQYHEGVKAIDEGVARVVAALEQAGELDNTLIIYSADQGLAWGQKGFKGKKMAPYNGTIQTPLIVRFPRSGKVAEGAVCSVPVTGADLVPTIYGFAGLEAPWTFHGHDLGPLLAKPKTAAKDWTHTSLLAHTGIHYGRATVDVLRDTPEEAIRALVPWYVMTARGEHKYVRYLRAGEPEELYDLSNDPNELVNLAHDPHHAERLESMREAVRDELRRTEAPFMDQMVKPTTME